MIIQEPEKICVVGAGHAAHAFIALAGYDPKDGSRRPVRQINVLAPYKNKKELMEPAMKRGITLHNPDGSSRTVCPTVVTRDPKIALAGVGIVILSLPAFVVVPMLRLIAPHLESGVCIGLIPAHGGYQWIVPRLLQEVGSPTLGRITIFGFCMLPFACRVEKLGHSVRVYGYKKSAGMACLPANAGVWTRVASLFRSFLPYTAIRQVNNFLEMSLTPGNACIHPARMLGLYLQHQKLGSRTLPLLYDDMDEASGRLISSISGEYVLVARAIEDEAKKMGSICSLPGVVPIETVSTTVYTPSDRSTTASIFRSTVETVGIKAPMVCEQAENGSAGERIDWSSRFFSEDIPLLCILHGLGQLVGIPTPMTDKVIRWGQKMSAQDVVFLKADGSLNTEVDECQRYAPQLWGIDTLDELLAVHS